MNNMYDRCPNCMNPYDGSGQPCQYCGQDVAGYIQPKNCLPPFVVLQDKYMIGRVLGQGGFGITYIGYDMNLATYVAIKEYYPESISTRGLADNYNIVTAQPGKEEIYNKNLNRFVEEARNLSKFYGLPGIVSVRNFFYENGTAYIVMDFVAGDNLKKYLADNGGKLDEATVLALMKPVLESLYEIHQKGLIHRDISPDNIMFDTDGSIKLIDFGAVRGSSAETDMTYTVMLKHGYAPQEQYYTKGNQGPWTDIYSLCATMYKMLTGNVPPNCIERMSEDSYIPPSQCGVMVSPGVESALTNGLSVNIADRYQNIGELIKDLYGKEYTFMGDGQIGVTQMIQQTDAAAGEKKPNKKLIGIIAGSVAALVVLIICLKVFVLGGDEDKATTQTTSTSEATATDATDTDATATDANATDATTEEVAEYTLDGTWSDFTFMIDDDYYELPMDYAEWVSYGWVPDMNVTVIPGETDGIRFHNDKMSCSATVANYSTEVVSMEECDVIGFYFSYDYYATEDSCTINLPIDVKLDTKSFKKSDSIEQAIEKYGEAGYQNLGEYISICQYTAEDGSYLTLYGGESGRLYAVDYMCYAKPEGAEYTPFMTIENLPYNENYEYPGETEDRFDEIFCIDGVNYKMWCPISQFIDNGWTLECEDTSLTPNYASMVTLRKGDSYIEARVGNTSIFTVDIDQTRIVDLYLKAENCMDVEIILPGGAKMGGNSSDISTLYSDLSDYWENVRGSKKEQKIYEYGVVDGSITMEVVSKKSEDEEDVFCISEYTYKRAYSASKANLENTDYIQGITVNN